jgi:hypothetical protein
MRRRTSGATTRDHTSAREHYQREKARRARRIPVESEVIADARREYLALLAAEAAKGKGIAAVVFDRGGAKYHGKVKALADAAREAGLKF